MHIYVVRYRNKSTAFFWNMQIYYEQKKALWRTTGLG